MSEDDIMVISKRKKSTANMLNSFKIRPLITFFPPKDIKGKYFSKVKPLPDVFALNGGCSLVR